MRLTVFRALVVLSAATTACQGLPSEEEALIVRRRVVSIELDTMTIDRIPFSVGGLLPAEGHGFVRAILWMASDEAPLRRGGRVRVELLASDGEYEVIERPPRWRSQNRLIITIAMRYHSQVGAPVSDSPPVGSV